MVFGIKKDIISGFSVCLLALPLCLGISTASNFPPVAGILSAIVGGMLASFLGGAKLSIKGPAAGLIVITVAAVHDLGGGDLLLGYERTLAVGVVAALLQVAIAVTRKASLIEIIPSSVLHGMIAAIGLLIVFKQLYVMIGVPSEAVKPFELLIRFPSQSVHLNPILSVIGIVTFVIVIFWPFVRKVSSFFPSSLVILAAVIPLSLFLHLNTSHHYTWMGNSYPLGPEFLIKLPPNFMEAFRFPDFSQILTLTSLKYSIMYALIGSLESLLTVCVVDSMAPKSMLPSNLNKDLYAVGVANFVSALIGGLPMISEIVRSKANMDYGAVSEKSNFFHGFFMLLAVLFIPSIIGLIPLSALAALLICVGFRLASPWEFIHAYKIGLDHFIVFLGTFFMTLATDLLIGVGFGILLKLVIYVGRGYKLKNLFNPLITFQTFKGCTHIHIEGPLTFLSYLKLKNNILKASKKTKNIVIDLSRVTYLDHTVLKKFKMFNSEFKGVEITIEENQELVSLYSHPLSTQCLKNRSKCR